MSTRHEFYAFDEYVEEAKGEPFKLKISEDETLVIDMPSATALINIMSGLRSGDLVLILSSLAGDNWERLEELFGGVGHKVMPKLTEDMMDHFDLYEPVTLIGPGGGKVKAKRPTEIQALLNRGYRPAGEAHASQS